MPLQRLEPILAIKPLREIQAELLRLLGGLRKQDWGRPTSASAWTVKDVAAHLLDGDIRRLSLQRDQLAPTQPDKPIAGYEDLIDFLNQLNADWVRAAQRISPRVLIDLIDWAGTRTLDYLQSLDPQAPALWPVAWAGDEVSPNWFDLAREYTEKWHHQQQIREAVGAEGLTSRKWLHPVLDTFVRGLPHRYREVEAEDGAAVALAVLGPAGDDWTLLRRSGGWRLRRGKPESPLCLVELEQDTAWRLFTKSLGVEEARSRASFQGDRRLGLPIFDLVAVIARR